MDIRVETHLGPNEEAEPGIFHLGSRQIEVLEVLDRWLAVSHHYFKVRAGDGALYILRNDLPSGRWEMTWFKAPEQI